MAAEMERENLFARFCLPLRDERSLWPRWLFLRGLGLIFFSAFYSLYGSIHGLIGEHGILPAGEYLAHVARSYGAARYWIAPTLLWISSSDRALSVLVIAGLVASVALIVNAWPRTSIAIALVAFLSFIAAAQDFAAYQSDGMLLEAAFISLFFAPRGIRPRLGAATPPSALALWMLRWEMFRIYFESGVVKLASGEEQWRNLTAMDKYYENGPLPTWIGWYAQQRLPHSFHAFTALLTLVVELVLIWMIFLPRRWRIAAFFLLSTLQIGIIITANYAFLNYLVLLLGVLLLDDRFVAPIVRQALPADVPQPARWRVVAATAALGWVFYATVVVFVGRPFPTPLLAPAAVLEPFRIANAYGLFAVMTRERDEIEFQGTADGVHWVAYLFRYKAQNVREAPRIFAPYQPRFDWNLWFASLGTWESNPWLLRCGTRLLENSSDVKRLFRGDPFGGRAPQAIRTVLWRYRFSTVEEKRRTGAWWSRELIGAFAPTLARDAQGRVVAMNEEVDVSPPHAPE